MLIDAWRLHGDGLSIITGKKTPGGAGTHMGHTGHTGARGHTDHTDEPHNHPPKPKRTQTRTRIIGTCSFANQLTYPLMKGSSHRASYARAPVGVHTTPCFFTPPTPSSRSRAQEGLASSRRPRGATRGQEGDARVGPPPHHTTCSHPQGTNAARHPCRKFSVLLTLYIISATQQPLRLRAGGWA